MHTSTLLPEFPHLRFAPAHVTRGLRAECPTAELVYMGWGRWILLEVRPKDEAMASGRNILARARRLLELWEVNPKYKANPGAFRRLIGRHDYGLLASMGARPIAEYRVQGEPTSAIVDDYRCMWYLFRTMSDQDVDQALHAEKEKARADAHADLTDEARARAGWRFVFTKSHYNGAKVGQDLGPRSGFRRVTPTPVLSS